MTPPRPISENMHFCVQQMRNTSFLTRPAKERLIGLFRPFLAFIANVREAMLFGRIREFVARESSMLSNAVLKEDAQ